MISVKINPPHYPHLCPQSPGTFASVARQAQVSTWLAYTHGLREHIEQTRTTQHTHAPTEQPSTARSRGLEADLALAREEIKRLRTQRDHQHQQLQLALGARMDNLAKADLVARLDELTRHDHDLATTADGHSRDNETLRARITELEDDLTAARVSLRRMIRRENTPNES